MPDPDAELRHRGAEFQWALEDWDRDYGDDDEEPEPLPYGEDESGNDVLYERRRDREL